MKPGLVITRKLDEQIIIHVPGREPIVITLVRTGTKSCRLHIAAEQDIAIHRKEPS